MAEQRKEMKRYEIENHARFLTFSCFHRLPLFEDDWARDLFAERLIAHRQKAGFHLLAWVVMPEHVHLLLWPKLPMFPVAKVLWGLKRDVAKDVIGRFRARSSPWLTQISAPGGKPRLWQPGGGHDRNIFSDEELWEKIGYINQNPVRRGLVQRAEDWPWSSARWHAGNRDGELKLDPARRPP